MRLAAVGSLEGREAEKEKGEQVRKTSYISRENTVTLFDSLSSLCRG